MDCRETRASFATGRELSFAQQREVQAHVATCATCAAIWQREERAIRALRSMPLPSTQPPDHVALALHMKRWGAARGAARWRHSMALASVALVVALLSVFVRGDIIQRGIAWLPPFGAPNETVPEVFRTGNANPVVTISFAAPESDRALYARLIKAFEAQNPDMRVRFLALEPIRDTVLRNDDTQRDEPGVEPFDPTNRVMRATVMAADTVAPPRLRPEDIANGYVRDLRPFMEVDPSFARDDFYPGAFPPAAPTDAIYSLPHTLYVSVLRYNKDLFAARGVPMPTPQWGWQEWLNAAERLANKRGDTVEVYGLLDQNGFTAFLGTLAAGDSHLFTSPLGAARLDRPEVLAAMERVAAMVASGAIYDGLNRESEADRLLSRGQIGIWINDMRTPHPTGINTGTALHPVAPLPLVTGDPEGFIMSSGTEHPHEAWRWLAFLSQQELPGRAMDSIRHKTLLPARRSLAERSGIWQALDAETAAVVNAAIQRPAPSWPADFFRLYTPFSQALTAVLRGEQSPAEALQAAQAMLDNWQARLPTPTTPERIVVATPVPEVTPSSDTKPRQ